MSYFRSINQEVTVAFTDSSNLAANQTFTSSGYSTLGVVGIQLNLKADQNCQVYVDQGPDNTNWYINDLYNYYNNIGGAGWTIQATDAYARVRCKNIGAASTNSKVLSMVLCPIVEAVPRALTSSGNLRTACYEMQGMDFQQPAIISPGRALKVTQTYRMVGPEVTNFIDTTNFWTVATTGSGSVTASSGESIIATGITASSTASMSSRRRARYVPVTTNFYRGVVMCPTQTGACNRRWGAYDANDGFIYNYDGTNLNLLTRKNGVDSTIANGTFNGYYGLSYNHKGNDGTVSSFEVFWTNRAAWFLINDLLLHTATGTTTTLVATPHLLTTAECNNGTGNTANNQLNLRTQSILRLGEAETAPMYAYAPAMSASAVVLKYGPGRLHSVVINQLSGNNADRMTLYDGTSAVNAFSVFNTNQTASIGAIQYHLDFYNGLTYIFNGSGGTPNCTILYE